MKPRISAERDIIYVNQILMRSGFRPRNITVLKNADATKVRIVKAMIDLAKVSRPGDVVYIHFSGHGQLMTDIDGDEDPDILGQKWDEAWIPYDASFQPDQYDQGERHLCDDEVGSLLSEIRKKVGPTGEILVVIDACHSGSATRAVTPLGNNETDSLTTPDISPYADQQPVTRGTHNRFIIQPGAAATAGRHKIDEEWITVSACKANQVNSEMQDAQGLRIGKLTYGLFTLQTQLSAITNQELEEYLITFMDRNKHPMTEYVQKPQVTGAKENHHISNTFRTQRR